MIESLAPWFAQAYEEVSLTMERLKRIEIAAALLSCTALLAFGQSQCAPTDFAFSFAEGLRKGQQLKIERERAQAERDLVNAQAAAIRAQTAQAAIAASAAPTVPPQFSPGTALCATPEFHALPMATRIKFIRAVEPDLSAKYTDQDFEKVLALLALKVIGPGPAPK